MKQIRSEWFSEEHIRSQAYFCSPQLAEQAIYCLELVRELAALGLSFQFKGGNSLLLILGRPRRFSIDVDIATDESQQRIEQLLNRAIDFFNIFISYNFRQHKTKPWLPMASYYLYYNSHFNNTNSIMLDIQLRRSPYKTHPVKIKCGSLYLSDEQVEVPYPSSIIGDKLLTIGPKTLGIPLGKGKEAQRIKHLFDISLLLECTPQLKEIRNSFYACLEQENQIQGKKITAEEYLEDVLNLCSLCALNDEKSAAEENAAVALKELFYGIEPFATHLLYDRYCWLDLQENSARAACCLTATVSESVTDTEFYTALNSKNIGKNYPTCEKLNTRISHYWSFINRWIGHNVFEC